MILALFAFTFGQTWYQVPPFLLAQQSPSSNTSSGGGDNPFANQWINFGLLGLFVVAVLYLKVVVPGWVYADVVRQRDEAYATIKEKDDEIARLRDLSENQTIPLVQRALFIMQRYEEAPWSTHTGGGGGQAGGFMPPPQPLPPPGSSS